MTTMDMVAELATGDLGRRDAAITPPPLLETLAASPRDEATRLIHADWLKEYGDPLCNAWREPVAPTPVVREYGDRDRTGDGRSESIDSWRIL